MTELVFIVYFNCLSVLSSWIRSSSVLLPLPGKNIFRPVHFEELSPCTKEDWRTGGRWFEPLTWPIFFPRIDDIHCNRIQSTLTTVHCFYDGYVGKQPVAWKEYCAECWLKEPQESMDRCTGNPCMTENGIKHHTINEPF